VNYVLKEAAKTKRAVEELQAQPSPSDAVEELRNLEARIKAAAESLVPPSMARELSDHGPATSGGARRLSRETRKPGRPDLVRDQEVGGSNPLAPTTSNPITYMQFQRPFQGPHFLVGGSGGG
jgi:hypothetical protein